MPVHRRDHETGEVMHERDGDTSRVVRWGDLVERWFKLFWPILALVGTWFAGTVWVPIRQVPILVEQMEAAVQRLNAVDAQTKMLVENQSIQGRILCFTLDAVDRGKYAIDCSKIPLPSAVTPR